MLDDVWQARDFPVLREVARRADERPRGLWVSLEEIGQAVDLDEAEVERAAFALYDAGLVHVDERATMIAGFTGMTSEARKIVGLWPSEESIADRLIASLEQAVDRASTPEERTRRQRILDAVRDGGRDFAVALGAGILTGKFGG
jgi:DNA-binding transcriptional ArsR family regulator